MKTVQQLKIQKAAQNICSKLFFSSFFSKYLNTQQQKLDLKSLCNFLKSQSGIQTFIYDLETCVPLGSIL